MAMVRSWASLSAGEPLHPFEFDPGPLSSDQVEIAVEYCGICHSDLSVVQNDWGITSYPVVPGHEAIGRVVAVGEQVAGLHVGQRVGVGWHADSCMHCRPCLSGNQNLCAQAQPTIVKHYGAFAERLRCHWAWAIPLPEALDAGNAGPLLCGGITVFSPLLLHNIKPTERVGVVGIGGLGHMALKFLHAWGCEVTAFTSSAGKRDEAIAFGAHQVVSSRDANAMQSLARSLDLLMVAVNVPLDWDALLATLAPQGRLHLVGAVLEPIPVKVMPLILGQQSISASPTGSPAAIATMLDFAARHQILPTVEHFPMSRVNDAFDHLRAGKARYRIVLDADFT